MSLRERLTRGSDDLDTPAEAVDALIPFLPQHPEMHYWHICEPAPGREVLARHLGKKGYGVTIPVAFGWDFLKTPWDYSEYSAIITNPPFSKKAQFIARCMEIGKPWALLLPVTTLGVRACQKNLHDAEIIFLPKRIDFTGKKAPWFAVMWVTWSLGIGKQLNFVEG